ncbi:MAG: hypothetical protein ACI9BD_000466 [Candidatus Marinamargulisbacteria bacterium]|jgi:hypothetical protein
MEDDDLSFFFGKGGLSTSRTFRATAAGTSLFDIRIVKQQACTAQNNGH